MITGQLVLVQSFPTNFLIMDQIGTGSSSTLNGKSVLQIGVTKTLWP